MLTRHQAGEIAEEAATRALKQFFFNLGVDTTDIDSMETFKGDLKFLAAQHKGSDELKIRLKDGLWYAVGIVCLGALYLGWDILKVGVTSLWSH